MTSKIDLHVHTSASDGVFTPREVVALAQQRGLQVIAITDHDTTEGVAPALVAAENTRLTVIPGIEVSTDVPRAEVHVLGYFIDFRGPVFQQTLLKLRHSRIDRAQRMVAKLADLGLHIEWKRVQQIAGDATIGRPHIAQALWEKGFVSTPSEAFALYLGRTGPAYVERYKLTPEEAVQFIISARGLPVLAHPIISSDATEPLGDKLDLERLVPQLKKAGLIGMEAYYAGYTPEMERYLLDLALQHGLIATGGSDFHGWSVYPVDLGSVNVPQEAVDGLYAALAARKA
ncbi:MAG: PHP domain-containing protein [Chloroflexi bacterium]|nr:PHP domain-containing protein [Chloroflexota bacterium]